MNPDSASLPAPWTPPETPEDLSRTIRISEATLGTSIGAYKLIRQIGEGGMGIVYQAQQLQPLRRDVALKVIKPGMDSKQVIARFESERRALALMDHPNIARVFDAGTTATGLPYFVMELVDGVPITTYCDSRRLTIRERIELFIPVCQAIQHAHQKGIIHRDIKPSNILTKQQENQAVSKVIDFGLAKALGGQLTEATMMTNLGNVMGTFQYMSPEQADVDRQDLDTRSDVYSLGVVLYELLAGTTPLESQRLVKASYLEILHYIREQEATLPSERLRQSAALKSLSGLRNSDSARIVKLLNHELDWIVMKALEKDRTRRYETVSGLVRDLQRYLEGEPVEAAPPSTAYRLRKFVGKYRLLLATTAAFVLVLSVGVVVTTWMAVRAGRAEQEALAVNTFLQTDLLAQASTDNQARPDTRTDPNLTVRTALDRAAARIEGKFTAQPLVEASIRQTISSAYIGLGVYQEAQRQVERALDLRLRVLGDQNPQTLESRAALATVLERQGKFSQAESLYVQVLEQRRRVLGNEHPSTLRTMYSLAATYGGQGKYDQSEALYTKLLEVQKRVLGETHFDTLASLANLAAIYHFQRKYTKAEPLYTQVLEQRRRLLGEEHTNTLQNMANLAELYTDEGKYSQAEPLYSHVVAIQRRVLGENHRSTIYTLNSMAGLQNNQGQFARAETLYNAVLKNASRGLGQQHPLTLTILNGLASAYHGQGKSAQAERTYSLVLDFRRRVLGPGHPDTIKTLASLGEVRLEQHEYIQAEIALREALALYEKTNTDRSERYGCQSSLGASLLGQKKYTEAEPLLISGYEGMLQREVTMTAQDRSSLTEAGHRVVKLYTDWGKPEKAVEWGKRLSNVKPTANSENP